MSEYEKLCEAIGLKKEKHLFLFGKPNEEFYPVFSAEKQLELIKLLISVFKLELWQMRSLESREYASMAYNRIVYNNDFSEMIAGLVLELLKNNQLNTEDIKKILAET